MISPSLIAHLEKVLAEKLGTAFHIFNNNAVSGGSINYAHKLATTSGKYFLKVNNKVCFPRMF